MVAHNARPKLLDAVKLNIGTCRGVQVQERNSEWPQSVITQSPVEKTGYAMGILAGIFHPVLDGRGFSQGLD